MGKSKLTDELFLKTYMHSMVSEKEYSDKLDKYILLLSFGVLSGWFSFVFNGYFDLYTVPLMKFIPGAAILTIMFTLYTIKKSIKSFTISKIIYTQTFYWFEAEDNENKAIEIKKKIDALEEEESKISLSVERWNKATYAMFVLLLIIVTIGGMCIMATKKEKPTRETKRTSKSKLNESVSASSVNFTKKSTKVEVKKKIEKEIKKK